MKHRTLLSFSATVLAVLILSSCGTSNKLQTITLSADSASSGSGFFELTGEGGTIQLVATGNYSNTQALDITHRVTYTVTPVGTDQFGTPLPAPPQTITVNATGLATAVEPFVCSYTNLGTQSSPSWFLAGSYRITASFDNVTSQPVYIGMASAAGGGANGQCGP